jgi:hypothetical protein
MKFYKPLVFIAIFLSFSINTILAFDCPRPGTPTEELKRATAVFAGKVIERQMIKITDTSNEDFGGERLHVKLKIDKWWKGNGESEVLLQTSRVYFPNGTYRAGEDFFFNTNQSYLVYAFYYNGAFGTSGCTRTRELSKVDEDLKNLGEWFQPKEETD